MDQNFEPRDQKHSQLGFNERDRGHRKIKEIQDLLFENYLHLPFSTLILYHPEPQICISIKEWPLGEEQLNAENEYG